MAIAGAWFVLYWGNERFWNTLLFKVFGLHENSKFGQAFGKDHSLVGRHHFRRDNDSFVYYYRADTSIPRR